MVNGSDIFETGQKLAVATMADHGVIIKDNAPNDEMEPAPDKDVLASSEKILQRNKAVYDKLV